MGETRRRWTTVEDTLLWELFQLQEKAPTGKCRKINWNEIARQIPGRSNKDCRKRFYNRFTGGLRKGSWTPDEDARLTALVQRYQYRWATIAQKMETRNADQCSKRWHHCLNPELERSPWTDAENQLLLAAVETHGSSWKDIQKSHFPTRSANNIKNQYTILSRRSIIKTSRPPCCDTHLFSQRRSNPVPTPTRPVTSNPAKKATLQEEYHFGYPSSMLPTPQLSSSLEYFATTPETPMAHAELDGAPPFLNSDPSQYISDYWPTNFLEGPWIDSNVDPIMCQPTGFDFGGQPAFPQFSDHDRRLLAEEDNMLNPNPQLARFSSLNTHIGF